MKLSQVFGTSTIPRVVRHRIEAQTFYSAEAAVRALRRIFPNHVIVAEAGKISVRVRDKSLSIAVFEQHP